MAYIPRTADVQIASLLSTTGVVVIEGPRAVGKTETAKQFAKSRINLATNPSARALVESGDKLVLEGDAPRLIDEWQWVPGIWELVKEEADDRWQQGLRGQFLLTGSSTPNDGTNRTTAPGRVSRVKMRPMSLFETGHSNGAISLLGIFSGTSPRATDQGMTLNTVIERICVGGWPGYATGTEGVARAAMRSYLDEISRTDIRQATGRAHDPLKVKRVLRSLARNVGTKVPVATITNDTAGANAPLDRTTVAEYLDGFERMMITEDLPAWGPHIRSKATVRSAPTRFFVDPCLAVAASQASPRTLMNDLEATGLLFENLVVRDLRIYAEGSQAHLSQYRDSLNREVDVILETFDGHWAALEVKLTPNRIDEGAVSLLKFANEIVSPQSGSPVFLAVITSTGYAYVRPDGVYVLPIGLLGP